MSASAKQSSDIVGSKRQRGDDGDQLHFGNDEAADVLAHSFTYRSEVPEAAAADESSSAAADAAEGRNFIAESYIVTIITRDPIYSAPENLADDIPGSSDLTGASIHELSERICIKKMQNLTRLEMLLTMGTYKGAGYENTSTTGEG